MRLIQFEPWRTSRNSSAVLAYRPNTRCPNIDALRCHLTTYTEHMPVRRALQWR